MTDNEIKKAFENVVKSKNNKIPITGKMLLEDTLDLINRLEAENDELKKRIVFWRKDLNYQPEKERAEAIKEFAERLCEGRVSNDPVVIAVKAELEMTESVNYESSKTEVSEHGKVY